MIVPCLSAMFKFLCFCAGCGNFLYLNENFLFCFYSKLIYKSKKLLTYVIVCKSHMWDMVE